jgi:HSP20 family protein
VSDPQPTRGEHPDDVPVVSGDAAPTESEAIATNGPADENGPAGEEVERYVFQPAIDIYDTDDGLVLRADLPGVAPDSLELQVQDNKLTLFGRVTSHAPEAARIVHQEYGVGDFLRSFILSDDVDHQRITAKLNQGVLRVTLPRAERPEPRRIQVEAD